MLMNTDKTKASLSYNRMLKQILQHNIRYTSHLILLAPRQCLHWEPFWLTPLCRLVPDCLARAMVMEVGLPSIQRAVLSPTIWARYRIPLSSPQILLAARWPACLVLPWAVKPYCSAISRTLRPCLMWTSVSRP